jgi:hypothetical protein
MTETPIETPVPRTSLKPPKAAPNVLRMFADHGWAARMWFLVAVIALAAALLEPYFIISAYRTRERVVILDETGTYHISPLLNFEDATKLHTSQTLLACIALFERNPNGYDYPDILEKMFLPDALTRRRLFFRSSGWNFRPSKFTRRLRFSKSTF